MIESALPVLLSEPLRLEKVQLNHVMVSEPSVESCMTHQILSLCFQRGVAVENLCLQHSRNLSCSIIHHVYLVLVNRDCSDSKECRDEPEGRAGNRSHFPAMGKGSTLHLVSELCPCLESWKWLSWHEHGPNCRVLGPNSSTMMNIFTNENVFLCLVHVTKETYSLDFPINWTLIFCLLL